MSVLVPQSKDTDIYAGAAAKMERKLFLGSCTVPGTAYAVELLRHLEVEPGDCILHVGTGSGYLDGILSVLARSVFSIAATSEEGARASEILMSLKRRNVQVLYGQSIREHITNGPYDAILITAEMDRLTPRELKNRLSQKGGRLVAYVGEGSGRALVKRLRTGPETFQVDFLDAIPTTPLLGDVLVEMGVVDRTAIELAAMDADVSGQKIGQVLVEHAVVEEEDIVRALAQQHQLVYQTGDQVLRRLNVSLLDEFPIEFLRETGLIPVEKRGSTVHFATNRVNLSPEDVADALNLYAASLVLVSHGDFDLVWSSLQTTTSLSPGQGEVSESGGKSFDSETIRMLEQILVSALAAESTHIHVDTSCPQPRIRFRSHGALRVYAGHNMRRSELARLVRLIKFSASLEVDEHSVVQAGRFDRRVQDVVFLLDVRVIPTVSGESLILGIRQKKSTFAVLEDVFPSPCLRDALAASTAMRSGLVLLVGDRYGSTEDMIGAVLTHISSDETRNVILIQEDDSIQYAGIQTLCTNGTDLPTLVANVISQDVDIVGLHLPGSTSVVASALRLAAAGHLVIATLPGDRLEASLEGALVRSGAAQCGGPLVFTGAFSRSSVQTLCPHCRIQTTAHPIITRFVFGGDGLAEVVKSLGCSHCSETGISGQVALTEFICCLDEEDEEWTPGVVQEPVLEQIGGLVREGRVGQSEFLRFARSYGMVDSPSE